MHRVAAVSVAMLTVAASLVLVTSTASAASSTLYAAVAATGTGTCGSPANACTLTTALTKVTAGGTIDLVTVGVLGTGSTYYQGPFTVTTVGTTAARPVSIIGPSGGAIIDGNDANTQLVNGADFLDLRNLILQDGGLFSPGLTNYDGGTVSLADSTIQQESDGAIDNADIDAIGVGGGTIDATDDVFQANVTNYQGGAINNLDGTIDVADSTFNFDTADSGAGGAIANGDGDGDGVAGAVATLTVTNSYFTSDYAGYGGAIDNGDGSFVGDATLIGDSFTDNLATTGNGGVIVNGSSDGTGTMTIEESTFASNSANDGDGGAIENGESGGTGNLTVLHSSFADDSTDVGSAISSNDGGTGHVTAGADLFGEDCYQGAGGTWHDLGYNAGIDATCFAAGVLTDRDGGTATSADLNLTAQYNPTVLALIPTSENPAVGMIPATASAFCPVLADERGIPSPSAGPCDAGAIQDPPGAVVGIAGTPLGAAKAPVTYRVQVQGFYGQVPHGEVVISDGKGGSCTTPKLVAESKTPLVTEGSCAIAGESAAHGPYTVTATYDGHGNPYGTSSASMTQSAAVANQQGVVTKKSAGITVVASGGTPGKDTVSLAAQKKNPNAILLPDATSYFDVATSKKATFNKVAVSVCDGVTKSGDLQWWNPAKAASKKSGDGWEKVVPASKPVITKKKSPCESFTLSATSSPSVKQLTGTSFATQFTPLRVSSTSQLLKQRVRYFGRITLHVTGGNSPYTWKVVSGTIPPGLKLSSLGVLSGTPTEQGVFLFTVQVSDTSTSTYTHQKVQTKITETIT